MIDIKLGNNHNPYIKKTIPKESNLEIMIAKIYIFLLPWRMISQFGILRTIFGPCAYYMDFLPHILGLLLMFVRTKGTIRIAKDKTSSLFYYFVFMILFMNMSSLLMAFILHDKLGTIGGEDTYRAVIGQIVYYTHYIFIILYNREVFRLISRIEMEQIFHKIINWLLLLGYLQIGVILFGGIVIKIHDTLDVFDILWPGDIIHQLERLSLSGSEPASAGAFITRFILPFLLAKILYYGAHFKTLVQLLLWLPIIYFTKSSTGYLLLAVCIVIFLCITLKSKGKKKQLIISLSVITLMALSILPFYNKIIQSEFIEQIEYLVIEKVIDKTNRASVSRKVPFVINLYTFLEYPILGVGNGNQGFFYIRFFPSWAYSSYDAAVLIEKAKTTIVNGSLFFPSILSGYGIVGVLFILNYIIRTIKVLQYNKKHMGMFYYMFIMSSIVIIVTGFSSEFVGNYSIWFLLSLVYMNTENIEKIGVS